MRIRVGRGKEVLVSRHPTACTDNTLIQARPAINEQHKPAASHPSYDAEFAERKTNEEWRRTSKSNNSLVIIGMLYVSVCVYPQNLQTNTSLF